MKTISRRNFNRFLAGTGALAASGGLAMPAIAQARPRVVVIGGGFGGASTARYLRLLDANIDVTLVETSREFITCPFSNLVLGGMMEMKAITHGYDALRTKHGINVVHDTATAIDHAQKSVRLQGGSTLAYDRLVVSPGIDIRWNAIQRYDAAAAEKMPHAWRAGAQTTLLRSQLMAMPDGGTFIMVAPADPFRCPPGPYERASTIAHYLKSAKPRSKILILDAKDSFSKQGLFTEGWNKLYPGMIQWVSASNDGKVSAVDPETMTVETDFGVVHKGDVINVIPPQRAGQIAQAAGLADRSGWCPVNPVNFESRQQAGVYVIGDAAIAAPMPKSGFSANSQGKIVAAAIVAAFKGAAFTSPSYANTCYSIVGTDYGISIAAVYRVENNQMIAVQGAGGVSVANADANVRFQEARYAEGWYAAITQDVFG
ncbi:MAG: cytochrome C [Alphaproteobacteria bacterium]|nr:cytochrome C [Alphaproteobacteria bacterium]